MKAKQQKSNAPQVTTTAQRAQARDSYAIWWGETVAALGALRKQADGLAFELRLNEANSPFAGVVGEDDMQRVERAIGRAIDMVTAYPPTVALPNALAAVA